MAVRLEALHLARGLVRQHHRPHVQQRRPQLGDGRVQQLSEVLEDAHAKHLVDRPRTEAEEGVQQLQREQPKRLREKRLQDDGQQPRRAGTAVQAVVRRRPLRRRVHLELEGGEGVGEERRRLRREGGVAVQAGEAVGDRHVPLTPERVRVRRRQRRLAHDAALQPPHHPRREDKVAQQGGEGDVLPEEAGEERRRKQLPGDGVGHARQDPVQLAERRAPLRSGSGQQLDHLGCRQQTAMPSR
mmetsp:Transcript_39022/g.123101  ORF Transcript_39022/g.123101 Transcript_39022/m.123101 type:complete len:243 (+) Transcript_39022:367-1095(+)